MIEPTENPAWPTTLRSRLRDGRLMGTDGSVWLYRAVPMAPVVDAKSPQDSLVAAEPLLAAYEELASMTSYSMARRAVARSSYRQTHLLLVNVPKLFEPDRSHPLAEYLRQNFRNVSTDRRILLLGVRLVDKVGGTGGLKQAIDSVVETLVAGQTPLSDFDADFEKVAGALDRAGLVEPSAEDIRLANAWWNHGDYPDTPMLVHADHLHFFNSAEAVTIADRVGVNECHVWDEKGVPGQHAVTFASVQDLDLPFIDVTSTLASWVSDMVSLGALVVSVRGNIEPANITRDELRRQRKRFIDDIQERAKSGKMERSEQQEMLDMLGQVEAMYAGGGASPTLAGTSIVVGFNGQIGDINQLVPAHSPAKMSIMAYRQPGGMAETMLCSSMRANPNLHDLPTQAIACSGIPSLNLVGDTDGAVVGFTERDRQVALLSPTAASVADGLPMCLVAGATGSGKLVSLCETIPTPSGDTTMGALKVGDEVIGRDGKPCRVTYLSPINQTPDLYRLTLSDGQNIVADFDHQWLVSDFHGRNSARKGNHLAAIENWEGQQHVITDLEALAARTEPGDMTLDEVTDYVRTQVPGVSWMTKAGIMAALDMVDAPYRIEERIVPRSYANDEVRKTDPVVLFPLDDTLHVLHHRWTHVTGGNAVRWAKQNANRADAAEAVLAAGVTAGAEATMPEIVRMLAAAGGHWPTFGKPKGMPGIAGDLRDYACSVGISPVAGFREVVIPTTREHTTTRETRVYDAQVAIKSLAVRQSERFHTRPREDALEYRMTTGEMLAQGLRKTQGHAEFAIRVTEALDLPDADLPVEPYLFGYWLGDGTSNVGNVTVGTEDIDYARAALGAIRPILRERFTDREVGPIYTVALTGLTTDLRAAGALNNKHIPMTYLRASADQRLAVLQGLMDTDGTVDANGTCELSLSDKPLATDALALIRSLGIKASISWDQPASYVDADGVRVECKDRHRIHFTTITPVFRLPRKAARQKAEVRETQNWLYITDIEPVLPGDAEYGPGRCITVDSSDHTYLVGDGYLPTSNTQLALHLAYQYSKMGRPTIFVDPKTGSDHSPIVLAAGGQVASLDELTAADGIFDPLRFAATKEVGVELAASMLMSVNPWGHQKDDMEVPLQHALSYGVSQGATCIGEALAAAKVGLPDLPPMLIQRVQELAGSSPMFRACVGIKPGGTGLRVAEGITLIKVGDSHLDLPEPGQPPASISQRIALALVRMMVFGSAMALTGRQGVVMLDEAWVFLGAGRSEVERLGRLARSQQVLPMMFTQRVSDAVNAGLSGYISRGIILPIEDRAEAEAACNLFKLDPTPGRLARITAKATMGASSASGVAPNWGSMRSLRDPKEPQDPKNPNGPKKVLRGSIAIYADLAGRAIPCEVVLPPEFLRLSSTNPDDMRRRDEDKARDALALQAAGRAALLDPGPDAGGAAVEQMF